MNKVVLITGTSSGIGKTMAENLSQKGCRVYGTSRKASAEFENNSYTTLALDVQSSQSINLAISQILEKEGRIDVLINNAGIATYSPLEESSLELVNYIMDVNLNGVLRMCQAVLPKMREQGSGQIINISSIGGLIGLPYRGIYCATKFALEGMTEALSMEVKSFGISVSLVEPGDFNTEIEQNIVQVSLDDNWVYKTSQQNLQTLAKSNAPGPKPVGDLIYKIITTKHPRLRYKIGSLTEKLSVVLKSILPGRVFERILIGFYRL